MGVTISVGVTVGVGVGVTVGGGSVGVTGGETGVGGGEIGEIVGVGVQANSTIVIVSKSKNILAFI